MSQDTNWETHEVIKHLKADMLQTDDRSALTAEDLEEYVTSGEATQDLYKSFERHNASFDKVDWQKVSRDI